MNSHDVVGLAQFCIDQHDAFDPADWLARGAADDKRIVVAAHYLSMTSWYGHAEELEHIVLELDPEVAKSSLFERHVRDDLFSLGQFSHLVRHGIAVRKLSNDIKPAPAPALASKAAPQFRAV